MVHPQDITSYTVILGAGVDLLLQENPDQKREAAKENTDLISIAALAVSQMTISMALSRGLTTEIARIVLPRHLKKTARPMTNGQMHKIRLKQ